MRFAPRTLLSIGLGALALGACDDNGTDPQLPTPVSVTANGTSATTVRVEFTPVAGAAGYLIERAPAGGTFTQVASVTLSPYDDINLAATTPYRYRVAAFTSSDTSAFSGEVTATTLALGAGGQVTVELANITAARRFDRDTVYVLKGFVKVAAGGVLTIESGTKIVGDTTTPGSALFVLPGGRIDAIGTKDQPIVFTSQRSVGNRKPGDWGGLIIVGRGRINRTGANPIIEGSNAAGVPGSFAGGLNYGSGTDNADNSGTLRYVRIEFAGYGEVANQELNSVTLAAVGSGTTIEYVQTVAGVDDGFEWFGGAVNGKFLVSYETGDDHFDSAEGYVGRNQFMIAFQSTILTPQANSGVVADDPQGFEIDGCNGTGCVAPAGGNAQSSQPYNMPVYANFTMVGTGDVATSGGTGGTGIVVRRGTGGVYVNGIVARYPRRGISVRDSTTFNREANDSLVITNILLAGNTPGNFDADSVKTRLGAATLEESPATVGSLFTAFPATTSTTTTATAFDWTPPAGSPALTGGTGAAFPAIIAARAGTVVTSTPYRGAAPPTGDANAKWWDGWTVYVQR